MDYMNIFHLTNSAAKTSYISLYSKKCLWTFMNIVIPFRIVSSISCWPEHQLQKSNQRNCLLYCLKAEEGNLDIELWFYDIFLKRRNLDRERKVHAKRPMVRSAILVGQISLWSKIFHPVVMSTFGLVCSLFHGQPRSWKGACF